jgi:hypothetical protein
LIVLSCSQRIATFFRAACVLCLLELQTRDFAGALRVLSVLCVIASSARLRGHFSCDVLCFRRGPLPWLCSCAAVVGCVLSVFCAIAAAALLLAPVSGEGGGKWGPWLCCCAAMVGCVLSVLCAITAAALLLTPVVRGGGVRDVDGGSCSLLLSP